MLDSQTAIGLSLVLHELGTNANKYGALSVEGGSVDLSWETTEGGKTLKLRWQEQGGPPVTIPSKRGFGTFIIEQSMSGLDGEAHIQFDPSGLVCDMRLPIKKTKYSVNEKE
jgi:two-component sensor histidine kinase